MSTSEIDAIVTTHRDVDVSGIDERLRLAENDTDRERAIKQALGTMKLRRQMLEIEAARRRNVGTVKRHEAEITGLYERLRKDDEAKADGEAGLADHHRLDIEGRIEQARSQVERCHELDEHWKMELYVLRRALGAPDTE